MAIMLAILGVSAVDAQDRPAIRALFVGIDQYRYARPAVANADFANLRGAVGDVGRIKDALRIAYRLNLDRSMPGTCRSRNAVSVTLTDACATRAAILAAFAERTAASAAGDTLIFYFAGHGSQVADDQMFDQASGMNSSILPTDARNPAAESDGDILDREWRGYIDAAAAKGVNVVTIFDSCNSATATRDPAVAGETRSAPPLLGRRRIVRPPPPIGRGAGGGYRVHLAASRDDEVAREIGIGDGVRAGVFTTALAQTLVAMPNATFADIANETRLRVEENGRSGQNPKAEGALNATMGGRDQLVALFDAASAGGVVTLAAGHLSGVTQGSTFDLFGSVSDALAADRRRIGRGVVGDVGAASATLRLDAPIASPAARLIARETGHAYGNAVLMVRNAGRAEDSVAIAAALGRIRFVRTGEPAQFSVEADPSGAKLAMIDGTPVTTLGPIDAGFAGRLGAALEKILRAQALLALRTAPAAADPRVCIDNDVDYDVRRCPQAPVAAPFVLAAGRPAKLTITNSISAPRNLYAYAIDDAYEINLLLPSGGGRDPPVNGKMPVHVIVAPDRPGRYRFVTIATGKDDPIRNAGALEQSAAGARDPGLCGSALERLFCMAASGTRDPTISRVGAWTATVTDVSVLDKGQGR